MLTSDERASLRSAVSTRPGSGLGPGGAAEELPQVDARPSSALSASNPRVVAFSEEDDLPTRTSRRRFERSASTGRGGVMNVLRNPAHQKQLLQERRRSVDAERHRRSASPDVGKTTAKKSPKLLALEKSGLYFPIVANGGILGGAGGERRGVDGGGVPETVRLHGSGNSKRSGRKHNGKHKKKNGRHSSSSTTTNRRKAKEKAARAATAATVGDGGDEGSSRSNATDGVDSPATTAPANPSKHRRSKPLPGVPDEATNDKRRQLREAAVAQAIKKSERRERTAEARAVKRRERRQKRNMAEQKRARAKAEARAKADHRRKEEKAAVVSQIEEDRETKSNVHFVKFIDRQAREAAARAARRAELVRKKDAAVAIQSVMRMMRARREAAAHRAELERLQAEAEEAERQRLAKEEALRQAEQRRKREAEVRLVRVSE